MKNDVNYENFVKIQKNITKNLIKKQKRNEKRIDNLSKKS